MKRYPLSYNPILEYYEKIQSGKVTVCDKIRKWYRHLSDKVINPTDGYHYEAKRGNHIIEFVENYDPDHYGAAFLVTVSGKKSPMVLFYSQTGHWYDENQIDYEVTAWMKLPERYKEMA